MTRLDAAVDILYAKRIELNDLSGVKIGYYGLANRTVQFVQPCQIWPSIVWCCGQGGEKIETWLSGGESGHDWDDIFIAVENGSRTVRGGWSTTVCRFNASVSAREGRWQDEALPEDEAETVSSHSLNGKEAWHGAAAWWCWLGERGYRGEEREDTTPVELTRILLGRKVKKIYVVDLVAINERWRFKTMMS
jgi:hypothetical protein